MKTKAIEQIREACVNFGFFQIVNHGIPLELLSQTMYMYKNFFACSDEEKLAASIGGDDFRAHKIRSCVGRNHKPWLLHHILYQDEVKGLEVLKDDHWIPIAPSKDKLIVNIGDVIQVLSNNKFKSATHRAVSPSETDRVVTRTRSSIMCKEPSGLSHYHNLQRKLESRQSTEDSCLKNIIS
ncbi:hypothetical protein KY290_018872 [Solanum tuberosum]|uniref:Uncharacterized protein n=1 Tax=Solanum tuberosum TaxID=4113 RepID=A0ABQ7VFK0_SOLTU|nr:hypothetical protein KY290_018872 [Solanum tuberosum]